jgi:hypothetical protein
MRVLNRVRTGDAGRRWMIPAWAFALPLLLTLALLIYVRKPPAPPAPNPRPLAVARIQPSAPPLVEPRRLVPTKHKSLPVQETFPAPLQLTDGELALLALAVQHPAAAEVEVNLGKHSSEPIQIEPLDIQPLQAPNGQ